jgi:GNAT superfamily N-acetyltransferase
MDVVALRAQYDREMRQDPPAEPGATVERTEDVVRVVGKRGWIAYSRLSEGAAPEVVRAEATAFRARGIPVEWKLYAHDGPPGLDRLLEANGFVADPPETLMVLDLEEPVARPDPLPEVRVARVEDRRALEAAVELSARAFAPEPGWDLAEYLPRLHTPSFAAFVASVGERPVSVARLELPQGRSFASLWGGGTLPDGRHRGAYRALVAARAEFARERGFRYLTVDARETSRPILERVGFRRLTSIVGWTLAP